MNKPEPPDDLWERLDEARTEAGITFERPEGSFTRAEFQEKFGLGKSTAGEQIRKLVAAGKIRRVQGGLNDSRTFYVLAGGKK